MGGGFQPLPQVPVLTLDKLVDGSLFEHVSPGQDIFYTINISNTSIIGANGVVVNDMLPAGLSLVSSSETQGSYVNGVWNVGTLSGETSATLTIEAKVDMPQDAYTLTLDNTHSTIGVTAYDAGVPFESGNMLINSTSGIISLTPNGDGVATAPTGDFTQYASSALPEINYDPISKTTEALVVDLGKSAIQATVNTTEFFPTEGGSGEYGEVTAFNANGVEVGKYYFGPSNLGSINGVNYLQTNYTNGEIGTFTVQFMNNGHAVPFEYLAFSSLPYGGLSQAAPTGPYDSSDYYVNSISYITPLNPLIVNIATEGGLTSTATVLLTEGDLSVTKVDNDGGSSITSTVGHAIPGETITYTIIAANSGPSDAIGATISDTLPLAFAGHPWTVTGSDGFTETGTSGSFTTPIQTSFC